MHTDAAPLPATSNAFSRPRSRVNVDVAHSHRTRRVSFSSVETLSDLGNGFNTPDAVHSVEQEGLCTRLCSSKR